MLYTTLKFVHVASIAVWFGGLFTMLLLNRMLAAAGDRAGLQSLGQQAQRISMRLFMPAVIITLITGIGMVQVGQLSFRATWVIWGMAGLVLSMFLGAVLTGGTARKLAARVAAGTIDAAGIKAAQGRMLMFAVLNLLLLLSIIWAMVAKPN